jgi:phosphate transport system protein
VDQSDLYHHISHRFNKELEQVRTRVLGMGGLVEQQLADATRALVGRDTGLAQEVVANDYKVNGMDVAIDELCTHILVRRQPTASDLRMVLTVIKTTADLERIGDEAKRVAKMAVSLSTSDFSRRLFVGIEHLAELVQRMLHNALDALARMDVEAAVSTAKEDRRVDSEYENIMRQAMTYMMEDPRSIPGVLDLIWAARSLERIGDRCCNISEYVIYFVEGKDVRHTDLTAISRSLGPGD